MDLSNDRRPIRAICTDIDGTLLNRDRELSPATVDTIKKVASHLPVILASSRMPSAMRHLQRDMGISEYPMIAYNGGYVLRYPTQMSSDPEILSSTEIPLEVSRTILDMGASTSLHFSLYQDDNWYAPRDDQWTQREARITKVTPSLMSAPEVLLLWEKFNRGAHKIMIMGAAAEITMLEEKLREHLSQQIHIYHSRDTYLELAPRSISKASGLRLIAERLYSLTLKNVMAFGDNYNDIEMLQSVGWGIAVENARPEVKQVAFETTEASIHDGVALAIRKYLGDLVL